jgi:DNA-binding transcriptional LysR family regulator
MAGANVETTVETQLLRTFVTVADAGSISAAASELGYVQSSVSEQLQRLERDLGATLLTRTSTGVTPTREGQRLLSEAKRVLDAVEDLRRTAHRRAPLRVGAVDTLALRWLPEVIAMLPTDRRPTITMDRRDRLLRALADGRCDLVVLYRPPDAPLPHLGARFQAAANRFEIEVLDTDDLVVVTAPEHHDHPDGWLVTQTGCVHREAFDRYVAKGADAPRIQAEAATPDALRQLARQGAGRALLPALAVADDLADGNLTIDAGAPETGGAVEIIAVHPPDAEPDVHHFLRRAVDHALSRPGKHPGRLTRESDRWSGFDSDDDCVDAVEA